MNAGFSRTRSHSRVSNGNPFAEAQFTTMKYLYDFLGSFASVQDARTFCEGLFTEYNHVHRHSGIGWHTPASVHFGTTGAVERFARRPTTPKVPEQSWINQTELQNT